MPKKSKLSSSAGLARRQWRRLQALLVDGLLGTYLALLVVRVWYYQVILGTAPPAFSADELIWYALVGGGVMMLAHLWKASPAAWVFDGEKVRGWRREMAVHLWWIIGISTILTGWIVTRVSVFDLFSAEGLEGARRIFSAIFSPDLSILWQGLMAIVETIYLAMMATLFAIPLAFVLSFLAARNLMKGHPVARLIYSLTRLLINFTRSIEPLIWAIIFTVWVGIGPFAGMLALWVHTVASLTKLYSEQIENINPGPIEAIEATGARWIHVLWFAVVPQVLNPFMSFTIYRWDINVRMATVIGLVGGGGIGTLLMQYQGLALWHQVGTLVILIALVVWIMDYLSSRIREALG